MRSTSVGTSDRGICWSPTSSTWPRAPRPPRRSLSVRPPDARDVSRASLEGTLPRDLPWIIAVVGVLLSAIAALTAVSLIKRRHNAELLAGGWR